MASIRKTRTGTWQVYWREPGSGKQVARNVANQAEAGGLRAEVEYRIDRGSYISEAARRIPLGSTSTASSHLCRGDRSLARTGRSLRASTSLPPSAPTVAARSRPPTVLPRRA